MRRSRVRVALFIQRCLYGVQDGYEEVERRVYYVIALFSIPIVGNAVGLAKINHVATMYSGSTRLFWHSRIVVQVIKEQSCGYFGSIRLLEIRRRVVLAQSDCGQSDLRSILWICWVNPTVRNSPSGCFVRSDCGKK